MNSVIEPFFIGIEKLLYVGAAGLLFFNALTVGAIFMRWCRAWPAEISDNGLDRLEFFFLSATLGLGGLGIAGLLFGFLGLYQFWFFVLLHGLIGSVGLFLAYRNQALLMSMPREPVWSGHWLWPSNTVRLGIFCLLIIGFSLIFLDRLNYVGGSDAQATHLNWVLKWIEAGRYFPVLNERTGAMGHVNSTQPLLGRILYLHGVLLVNAHVAALMQVGIGVLTLLGTYLAGRRLFGSQEVGWLAVLVYAGNYVLWQYHFLEVDDYLLTILFALGTLYSFLIFRQEDRAGWLPVLGLLLGAWMSTKHHGLAGGVFFLLFFAVYLFGTRGVSAWNAIFRVALLAVVICSPWYVQNWIVYGNPLYTSAMSLFPAAADPGYWYGNWLRIVPYLMNMQFLDAGDSLLLASTKRFLVNLVAHYPWAGVPAWFTFSPLYLPALLWGTLFFARKSRAVLIGVMYVVFFFAVGAASISGPKYMLVILAPVSSVVSYILLRESSNRFYRFVLYGIAIACAAQAIILLWPRMHLKPERTMNWSFLPKVGYALMNDLGPDAKVMTNGLVRYELTRIQGPTIFEEKDLTAERWEDFYCYYKRKGATHYLLYPPELRRVKDENALQHFAEVMKQQGDPQWSQIEMVARNWDRNIKVRDVYLSSITDINYTRPEGILVIELPPGLPEFCME